MVEKAVSEEIQTLGNSVINSFSGFVKTFDKEQKRFTEITQANLTQQRQSLLKVFSESQTEGNLYQNILKLNDFLDASGESINEFSKRLGKNADVFKDTIDKFNQANEDIAEKERTLRSMGLVVEREIIDGKLSLRQLTDDEIRQKQQEIIDKKKQIEKNEEQIEKIQELRDTQGQLTEEQLNQLLIFTSSIEVLNNEINNLTEQGIKEVNEVNKGLFASLSESYREGRQKFNQFTASFLPGPINQAVMTFVDAIEDGVGIIADAFKPLTALFKIPRLIAKLFGKEEAFDNALQYMKGQFLALGAILLKPFKALALAMKPVILGMKALALSILATMIPFGIFALKVGIIAGALILLGIGIYKLVTEFDKVVQFLKEKITPVFEAISNALKKVGEVIMKVVDFVKDKLGIGKTAEDELQEGDIKGSKAKSRSELEDEIRATGFKGRITGDEEKLRELAVKRGVSEEKLNKFDREQELIASLEKEKELLETDIEVGKDLAKKFGDTNQKNFGRTKLRAEQIMANPELREQFADEIEKIEQEKAELDAFQRQQGLIQNNNVVNTTQSKVDNTQHNNATASDPANEIKIVTSAYGMQKGY